MNESTSESKKDSKVYEISYILVPSLPQEKIGEQTTAFTAILAQHSAVVIDEEAPSLISLAYEMDKSSGGGAHQRFDRGYFGWVKFYCSPSVIEEIRKSFDQNQHILRSLAVSTVREKTYLGKRAKAENKTENRTEEKTAKEISDKVNHESESTAVSAAPPMSPAEIAAVDQKLDEMVKGA
jgi:ribosomal protein S6